MVILLLEHNSRKLAWNCGIKIE